MAQVLSLSPALAKAGAADQAAGTRGADLAAMPAL